ncbi:APOB1 complementation factor [Halocaridina rubra]|uniref:APOB1 complementation factor n=1 Tax=Halocaridina rubra TaxID=373956 RepID=A0AAN9A9B8_HALRR
MTSGPEGASGASSSNQDAPPPASEAAVQRIMEAVQELQRRTGYPLVQENSQRRYGPPPGWEGPPPPKGCEVFIGKIPRDLFEDELVPVLERAGRIYEVRIMMDSQGVNRGYGFVQYTNLQEAETALRTLNNYEIRPHRYLGITRSVDNNRLFVGGIPKTRLREEVLEEMKRLCEGVNKIILYPCVNDRTKNRGYAFVEFDSHKAAAMARRKFFTNRILLWGTTEVKVDWAEPELMVDNDTMSKVKVIYVRNLALTTTEDDLRNLCVTIGGVERVKKQKDYAFVHFSTREQAETAKASLNGRNVHGCELEVTWAKPVKNREEYQQRKALARSMVSIGQNQSPCFPFTPAGEPLIMMPQVRRAAGTQGIQNPMHKGITPRHRPSEPQLVSIPAAPLYIPQEPRVKTSDEILSELCAQEKWGEPFYETFEVQTDKGSNYNSKVVIPGFPSGAAHFHSEKLATSIDDARNAAADNVLRQLGNAQLVQTALRSPTLTPHYFVPPTVGIAPIMTPSVPAATNPPNLTYPAGAYFMPQTTFTGYESLHPYAMQAFYQQAAMMTQPGLVMEKARYGGTGE